MKKRLISLILCGVTTFGLVSCGDGKEKETSTNSNKTTISSSASSSNSKVDTEESDDEKVESTSSKDEYKSMTTDEALEYHNGKIEEIRKWLEEIGYEVIVANNGDSESLINGDTSVGVVNSSGDLPYYKNISYSGEIKANLVTVRYEFHYYVDEDALKESTTEMPKARDLLISEPYKIMTGDEISEETLNKIDEEIEMAYKSGDTDGYDYKLIETNGPFKVNLRFNGPDLTFQIISDGDGLGN